MAPEQKNQYWIPSININKRVITQEIQVYLGPESTVRPYSRDGEDGFLITTPGSCLTDEQIDDICIKSKEVWEKQAAPRAKNESYKQLKRPLNQPIVISRGSRAMSRSSRASSTEHRRSTDPGERIGRCLDERRHGGRYGREIYAEMSTDNTTITAKASLKPVRQYVEKFEQPDMNDPLVLELYTQLVEFRRDSTKENITFKNPNHSIQDLFHSLARKLGLEYEYSLSLGYVRVSGAPLIYTMDDSVSIDVDNHFLDSLDLDLGDAPEVVDPNFIEDGINSLLPDIFSDDSGLALNDDPNSLLDFPELDFNPPLAYSSHQISQAELESLNLDNQYDIMSIDPTLTVYAGQSSEGNCHEILSSPDGVGRVSNQDPLAQMDTETLQSMIPRKPLGVYPTDEQRIMSTPREFDFVPGLNDSGKSHSVITRHSHQDEATQAKSREVKAIGACWKCKVVRKKCDTDNPCQECLKGETGSTWQEIGCRRGPLGGHLNPLRLLPRNTSEGTVQSPSSSARDASTIPHVGSKTHPYDCSRPSGQTLKSHTIMTGPRLLLGSDFIEYIELNTPLHNFGQFLKVSYQICRDNPEYGSLIERAVQCLYSCSELSCSDTFLSLAQEGCISAHRVVEAMKNFEKQLKEYINELSRVFFKKKNLRGDKSWWIPTFCSLCIMGVLRKALLEKVHVGETTRESLKRCLHLAVRLFVALSSGFDPLIQSETGFIRIHYDSHNWITIKEAWGVNGIKGSSAFLRRLFDLDLESEEPMSAKGLRESVGNESPVHNRKILKGTSRLRSLTPISAENIQSHGALSVHHYSNETLRDRSSASGGSGRALDTHKE